MQLENELRQFTGTEHWYRHTPLLMYTDGIRFLADKGKAYWLIDAIASYQPEHKNTCPFQLWELSVNDDQGAVLIMRGDSGEPAKVTQEIEFTDFPLKHIELYCIDGVLLLPSEY